jgi:adenine-specific DNA-methyltransferase
MANLSQQKRERMLAFLDTLKRKNADDDDMLRAIGEIENELNSKKYGLVWEKHEEAVDVKMKDYIPVFTEDPDREITAAPGEDYNFLLEGDNLHSLKLLEKTHKGKIDVIYIDPPYNLGGDFVYDDSYIEKEDAFKHSKWLSFMQNRLAVAKTLLTNGGCIMISINDSEYANLKLLCDDIFSDENYQGTFIWKSRQRADSRNVNNISIDHEYILVYSRGSNFSFLGRQKDITKYKNPDNDPRGPWASIDLSGLADASRRPNLHYDIVNPETGVHYPPNPNRGWSKSKETLSRMIDEQRILWPSSPNGRPREKKFLNELQSQFTGFSSVLDSEDVGYTTDGTRSINNVLGNRAFSFPKSVKLLKTMINQIPNKECTILDFFAGSGTTAQAVLELNQEDGGNRHFILCTNNENDICENVTYPRVKTVITGIRPDGSKYSDGIPANLKYYKTDFVARNEEYLSDALLQHIAEMIQLENGIKLDGKRYLMILTDEQADDISSHWDQYPDVKAIYLSKNVLLTTDQETLFEKIPVYIIPDYYFDFELREEGESW